MGLRLSCDNKSLKKKTGFPVESEDEYGDKPPDELAVSGGKPLTSSLNALFLLKFTSISIPPVIKVTKRNGRTLVHRVPVSKENDPQAASMVRALISLTHP